MRVSVSLLLARGIAALLASGLAVASEPYREQGSLGSVVVIGDSLSAGFQNGLLFEGFQPHGYANVVVDQAVTSNAARAELVLPLVLAPGIGPGLPPGVPPGLRDCNPCDPPTDLAVPGQTLHQALTMRPLFGMYFPFDTNDPIQILTNYVLGIPTPATPMSQVEAANADNPNTLIVWLGNNDVLGQFEGIDNSITDPITFAAGV